MTSLLLPRYYWGTHTQVSYLGTSERVDYIGRGRVGEALKLGGCPGSKKRVSVDEGERYICMVEVQSGFVSTAQPIRYHSEKEGNDMLDRKEIAILAEEDFNDSELIEPMRAMGNAGVKVVIVGSGSREAYSGKRGNATVRVDATADKVNAEDCDGIIVPGGYTAHKMRLPQSMVDLGRKAYDLGKVVAAICHGPQLLISAGIVRNHRVAS